MNEEGGGEVSKETSPSIDIRINGKQVHPATVFLVTGTLLWLQHLWLNDDGLESETIAAIEDAVRPLYSKIDQYSLQLKSFDYSVVCGAPNEPLKAEKIAAHGNTDFPVREMKFNPDNVVIPELEPEPFLEDNPFSDLEKPSEPEVGDDEFIKLDEPVLSDETETIEPEIVHNSAKPEVSNGDNSIVESDLITPVIPDYDTSQGLAEVQINFSKRHKGE